MRRFLLFAVLACGCGTFLASSGDDDVPSVGSSPGGPDAAPDASSVADATGGGDGSGGDAAAGACTIKGPADVTWTYLDDADLEPASTARLTLDSAFSRGLLVAPGRHVVGRLRASFDFVVRPPQAAGGAGDGFALLWSTGMPATGGYGAALGACGVSTTSGFAIIFLDSGYVRFRRLSDCMDGAFMMVPSFVDDLAHHVVVEVDAAGHTKVFYDTQANPILEGDFPGGFVPATNAWVGFSAATGSSSALHKVRDVTLEFPDDPACP